MKPIFPSYLIKQNAKKAMRGNFPMALAITAVPALVVCVIAAALLCLAPGAENTWALITQTNSDLDSLNPVVQNLMLSTSALSIVFAFLSIGSKRTVLDMIRGKKVKFANIFRYYYNWYIAAIYPLVTTCYSYAANYLAEKCLSAGMNAVGVEIVATIADVVYFVVTYKLIWFEFYLADNDCKNFKDALQSAWKKTSVGNIVNYFALICSFILWFFVSALTGGLALLYVYPYMVFSQAMLYEMNKRFENNGAKAFEDAIRSFTDKKNNDGADSSDSSENLDEK